MGINQATILEVQLAPGPGQPSTFAVNNHPRPLFVITSRGRLIMKPFVHPPLLAHTPIVPQSSSKRGLTPDASALEVALQSLM